MPNTCRSKRLSIRAASQVNGWTLPSTGNGWAVMSGASVAPQVPNSPTDPNTWGN